MAGPGAVSSRRMLMILALLVTLVGSEQYFYKSDSQEDDYYEHTAITYKDDEQTLHQSHLFKPTTIINEEDETDTKQQPSKQTRTATFEDGEVKMKHRSKLISFTETNYEDGEIETLQSSAIASEPPSSLRSLNPQELSEVKDALKILLKDHEVQDLFPTTSFTDDDMTTDFTVWNTNLEDIRPRNALMEVLEKLDALEKATKKDISKRSIQITKQEWSPIFDIKRDGASETDDYETLDYGRSSEAGSKTELNENGETAFPTDYEDIIFGQSKLTRTSTKLSTFRSNITDEIAATTVSFTNNLTNLNLRKKVTRTTSPVYFYGDATEKEEDDVHVTNLVNVWGDFRRQNDNNSSSTEEGSNSTSTEEGSNSTSTEKGSRGTDGNENNSTSTTKEDSRIPNTTTTESGSTTTSSRSRRRKTRTTCPRRRKTTRTFTYSSTTTKTRRRKTRTRSTTTETTTTQLMLDIPRLMELITNLTMDYSMNLTDLVNKTLQDVNMFTCPPATTTTEPPTTVITTTPDPYGNLTGTIMAKCFVCGLDTPTMPRHASCADAFSGDFIPLVPVDATARKKLASYRKYCRWMNVPKYIINETDPRSMWGRWTGGCSVRWIDISGIYTQRTCRNRHRAIMGLHWASKRMAKLEMALQRTENACIISPMASLVPLSRGMSLYARFHACVCTGSWCNRALPSPQSTLNFVTTLLILFFIL